MYMMYRPILRFVFCCLLVGNAFAARVLIIDGQNNHDWPTTTAEARAILTAAGNEVSVATTPAAGAASDAWAAFRPDFAACDVVLLNYYGQDWPTPVVERLEKFVEGGGGLVAFHAGGSSF